LPSTPLKDTERRGDRWREAMGIEQTEIDALAALRPELLQQLARDAIGPFYDATLERRVTRARQEWLQAAQAVIDANLDADQLARIRADAEAKLEAMRTEIEELNQALRVDASDFDLPEMDVPTFTLTGNVDGLPLLDSRWSFAEQCRQLIHSKAYRNGKEA
jgi:hypothetical protein